MPQVWEFIFLMLILKIPIVYLGFVVYWAIKAEPEPRPPEQEVEPARIEPRPRPPWSSRDAFRRRRLGPHGSPTRGYRRVARAGASL